MTRHAYYIQLDPCRTVNINRPIDKKNCNKTLTYSVSLCAVLCHKTTVHLISYLSVTEI